MGGGWVEDMVCAKSNVTGIQTQKFSSYTHWKNKVTDSEILCLEDLQGCCEGSMWVGPDSATCYLTLVSIWNSPGFSFVTYKMGIIRSASPIVITNVSSTIILKAIITPS